MLLILSVNEIKFLGFLIESVECATVITGSQRRQHKNHNFFEFKKNDFDIKCLNGMKLNDST